MQRFCSYAGRRSNHRFARANSWFAFQWPGTGCIGNWRYQSWWHWGRHCAHGRLYSRHKGQATGDQIRSSNTTVLCMPSPPRAGNEGTLSCSTIFQNSTSACTPLHGRCHCWRCQCSSIQIPQKSGVPRSAQFFSFHYVERDATWG